MPINSADSRHLVPWILISLTAACAHDPGPDNATSPPDELAKLPEVIQKQVLSGNHGLQATLLELADDRKLIQIKGIEDDLDGKVVEHEKVYPRANVYLYTTTYNDQPQATLTISGKPGEEKWMLLLPFVNHSVPVYPDPPKTRHLDTAALLRLHREQKESGALAALARFDRRRNEKDLRRELRGNTESYAKGCKFPLRLEVDTASIPDQGLIKGDYASLGRLVLKAINKVCTTGPGLAFLKAHPLQKLSFGDKTWVKIEGQALRWSIGPEIRYNRQAPLSTALSAQPFEGKTLGQQIALSQTWVCRTPADKLVILAPEGSQVTGLYYGNKGSFYHIRNHSPIALAAFFEPRFSRKISRTDYSHISSVKVNTKEGTCTLTCGTQEKALALLPRAEIPAILEQVKPVPLPHQRKPYALARNRQGIYYFVDRGTTPSTEKDFRVYIGRRGRMRRQQMKDIVSDSKGEIFSTKNGDLRLVVSKTQAIWITGRKEQDLLWLPIKANQPMIYNELGPYLGLPLGNPCDEM